MNPIDLRSDTVTKPTPAMREAMAAAPVGDDVYGEDPTVNRLQELSASMLGKEAGLFVPSGTMGNLVAILAHCGRGDEIILGDKTHTFLLEAGGVSALGGIHSRQVTNLPDGTIALQEIRDAIRADDAHQPVSRLITLENTHNRCAGAAITAEYTQAVGSLAHEYGMYLHVDGARIFNAAAKLGVSAADLVAPADSVTFCLSKGLSAPVGSVVCGTQEFIRKAHRIRKQLGGGMRQAGIIAAAGIVALETMVDRLSEDHQRAQCLASQLERLPGLHLALGSPHTNMVYLELDESFPLVAAEVAQLLKRHGVLVNVVSARRFRLVVHNWIDDDAVNQAVSAFRSVLQEKPQ